MKSPAETSSAIESAICAVTSDVRKRAAPRVADDFPELSRSAVDEIGRVLWSAGNRPNRRPVAIDSSPANAIAWPLSVKSSVLDTFAGSSATIAVERPVRDDEARDAAEHGEEHGLGEQLREQLPSRGAEREADRHLSERLAARASSRFAMLAHAMSSTMP